MAFVRAHEATEYDAHGARFSSYLRPSTGSTELCAWRLDLPPRAVGVAHRPSREEALLVLEGELVAHLDGEQSVVRPGDLLHVPAEAELRVDGGPQGASVWVTALAGLEATLPDGSRFVPPWAS